MLGPLFAAGLTAMQPVSATDDTLVLEGVCEYPEAVRQHRLETMLAICNQLTIARDGGDMAISFGPRGLGPSMVFTGKAEGKGMDVRQVTLRRGEIVMAGGSCEIFYADGEIAQVSCLASEDGRGWAGNFVHARP